LSYQLAQLEHVERCGALHSLATSDLVVLESVFPRPPACALRDVAHYGLGGADELVGAFGVTSRELLGKRGRKCEELDGMLIDV
jgi:hypothetical protein